MTRFCVVVGRLVVVGLVIACIGWAEDEPRFLRWLDPNNPTDRTIRAYWEAVEADQATVEQIVDLGTLLFDKGFFGEAIDFYELALEREEDLAEAYLRIGLVEHRQGKMNRARRAYRRCLEISSGHGWCNFYLGMASEELGKVDDALYYYERAFRFSPELADPAVNPQVLYSELQLAVRTKTYDGRFLERNMPMELLEPEPAAAAGRQQSQPEGSSGAGLVPAEGDEKAPEAVKPKESAPPAQQPGSEGEAPVAPHQRTPERDEQPFGSVEEQQGSSHGGGLRGQRLPRSAGGALRRVPPTSPSPSPTPSPEASPPSMH